MLLGMYRCMYSKVRQVSEFVLYKIGIFTKEKEEKNEKNVGEALAVACERRHGLQLGSAGSKSPGTWQRLRKKGSSERWVDSICQCAVASLFEGAGRARVL